MGETFRSSKRFCMSAVVPTTRSSTGTGDRSSRAGDRSESGHVARWLSLDIPEGKIRERYDRSRITLIELMPQLTEPRVFENSFDTDPACRARLPSRLSFFALRRGRSWRRSTCLKRVRGPRPWWPQRSRSRSDPRGLVLLLPLFVILEGVAGATIAIGKH